MVNFFFVDIWKIVPGIMFFRGGAPSPRIALFLNISDCRACRTRIGVQIFRNEFHTHIFRLG